MSIQNARETNQRAMHKTTTSDFSAGGMLNRQQFNEFFLEVQDSAQVLDQIRAVPRDDKNGQIDKLGVGTRILRSATEATAAASKETPDTGKVDYDTVKVEVPWDVSSEVVEDTIEQAGTADKLVQMFSNQFAVDSEDLGFNGDTTSADPFEAINDGWIVKAEAEGAAAYDHLGATINTDLFEELLASIPPKYRRDPEGLKFLMSLDQKQAYKQSLVDRSTSAGDAMLMTNQEPTPYGFEIETPVGFPSDRVMLTDPRNLIWVVQRDMKMRFTDEGAKVVENDLFGIYNMLSRTDYVVEDGGGVALANNVA